MRGRAPHRSETFGSELNTFVNVDTGDYASGDAPPTSISRATPQRLPPAGPIVALLHGQTEIRARGSAANVNGCQANLCQGLVGRRRKRYNIGLVFAGIGYLFMIGIANLCYKLGPLSERIVQPNQVRWRLHVPKVCIEEVREMEFGNAFPKRSIR
jgi:hypothetical protein